MKNLNHYKQIREDALDEIRELEKMNQTTLMYEDVLRQIDKGVEKIDIAALESLNTYTNNLDIDLSESIQKISEFTASNEKDIRLELDSIYNEFSDKTESFYSNEEMIQAVCYMRAVNEIYNDNEVKNASTDYEVNENEKALSHVFDLKPSSLEGHSQDLLATGFAVVHLSEEQLEIDNFKGFDQKLENAYNFIQENNLTDQGKETLSSLQENLKDARASLALLGLGDDFLTNVDICEEKIEKMQETLSYENIKVNSKEEIDIDMDLDL